MRKTLFLFLCFFACIPVTVSADIGNPSKSAFVKITLKNGKHHEGMMLVQGAEYNKAEGRVLFYIKRKDGSPTTIPLDSEIPHQKLLLNGKDIVSVSYSYNNGMTQNDAIEISVPFVRTCTLQPKISVPLKDISTIEIYYQLPAKKVDALWKQYSRTVNQANCMKTPCGPVGDDDCEALFDVPKKDQDTVRLAIDIYYEAHSNDGKIDKSRNGLENNVPSDFLPVYSQIKKMQGRDVPYAEMQSMENAMQPLLKKWQVQEQWLSGHPERSEWLYFKEE